MRDFHTADKASNSVAAEMVIGVSEVVSYTKSWQLLLNVEKTMRRYSCCGRWRCLVKAEKAGMKPVVNSQMWMRDTGQYRPLIQNFAFNAPLVMFSILYQCEAAVQGRRMNQVSMGLHDGSNEGPEVPRHGDTQRGQ